MKSFFEPVVEADLRRRIGRLSPDTLPRWGLMSCPEMVCHLTDAFRGSMGEHGELRHSGGLLTLPVIRALVAFRLPWLRGRIPAPRAYQTSPPGRWESDLEELDAAIDRFLVFARGPDPPWQDHPLLGRMSTREWGWLAYKHTDHHLRQFGV